MEAIFLLYHWLVAYGERVRGHKMIFRIDKQQIQENMLHVKKDFFFLGT